MKKFYVFLIIFIFSFNIVQAKNAKMPECKCNKIKFNLDKSIKKDTEDFEEKEDKADLKPSKKFKKTKIKLNNKKDAKQ